MGPGWFAGCTWTGLVDVAGQPAGHGAVLYPANFPCEFCEGVIVAGTKVGRWIEKWRDGTWLSRQYVDGFQSKTVRPGPRPFGPAPARGRGRAACGVGMVGG